MASQKGKKSVSKSTSGVPTWVWTFAAIALAVIVGSFIVNRDSPRKGRGKHGAKEKKNPALSHNLKNLELLEQVSNQVSQLAAEGKLTDKDTKEYSEVIDLLLDDLAGEDDITKQIRTMASVVRAQLLGAGKGLEDAEVEAKYNVSTYSSPRFWEEHYRSGPDAKLDWYVEWGRLLADGRRVKDLVKEHVSPEHRILVLGCGNSPMSLDMYRDGYRQQHNIDVSAAVIEQMQKRHADEMQGASWEVMDARQLSFTDGHFDAVIDKGTFDAVSTDATASAAILGEVERVLRAEGSLISIGSKRLPLFESSSALSCGVDELRDASEAGRQASVMHRCRRAR